MAKPSDNQSKLYADKNQRKILVSIIAVFFFFPALSFSSLQKGIEIRDKNQKHGTSLRGTAPKTFHPALNENVVFLLNFKPTVFHSFHQRNRNKE